MPSIQDLEYAALQAKYPAFRGSLNDLRRKDLNGDNTPTQSVSDLKFQNTVTIVNAGTTVVGNTLTDVWFKSLGGPTVPPQSIEDLRYASLSGGGPVGPGGVVTGLQAWFKADGTLWKNAARTQSAVVDGDFVYVWDDSSVNVRNATSPVAPTNIVLKTNQANGKPCVRSNGDRLLTSSGFLTAAPVTLFAVFKNPSWDVANENWVGSNSNGATLSTDQNGKVIFYAGSSKLGSTAMSTTAPQIVAGIYNGAASKGWLAGGVPTMVGDVGALGFDGLNIFSYHGSDNNGFGSGDIFEVIAYNRVLSLAELDQVGNYLAAKYGITWAPAQAAAPFNPLTAISWHTAVWAEDAAWSHPADGAAVATWRDGSGHSRDLVQATGTMQPLYRAVTAALGGRPAIEFDGVDDSLAVASFTAVAPPFSLVVVGQRRGAGGGGNERAMCRVGGGAAIIMDPSTKKWVAYNGNNLFSVGTYDTFGHLLAAGFIGPTNSYMNVDGASGAMADPGGGSIQSLGLAIGQVASDYGKMTIAFAALYAGDVTQDANWALFKTGIYSLYGLSPAMVDSFNRADSSTTLGNTDTGQPWTYPAGTWGITSSSVAYTQVLGAQESVAIINANKQDMRAQFVISAFANSAGLGAIARFSDINNYYLVDTSGSSLILYKKVAGTFTQLASGGTTVPGDTIGINVQGTTIQALKNGVVILTATDSSVPPGTYVGMRNGESGAGPGTARYDSFVAN
jgi:hypothetical protein